MMTCCIWVSMAWRIARRSSPFSFLSENVILILLRTPCDECVWYTYFITRKLFSSLVCSLYSILRDRYATLSAELLTNAIYSSILLNSIIYETHEVSLSDRGSAGMHIRRSRWLFPV